MSLFLLFLATAISAFVWFGGVRFIHILPLPFFLRMALWGSLLFALIFSPLLIYLRTLGQKGPVYDTMAWIGYLLMGAYSILICGVIIRDLGLGISVLFSAAVSKSEATWGAPLNPSRRGLLIHGINFGLITATAGLTGLGLKGALSRPEIITVTHPTNRKGIAGLRIVQISDIHVSHAIRRPEVERIVTMVNDLNPDMVVLTGDLVDGSVSMLKNDVAPLSDIEAPMGCYFVTGNHEYYSGVIPWIEEVKRLGFDVLINSHRILTFRGKKLVVAGVTDFHAEHLLPDHSTNPAKAVADAPGAPYRILLAHQPLSFPGAKAQHCDLTLSGHTHGGQYLPFTWAIHVAQPWVAGLYEEDGHRLYVNRGTAFWGPPLRIGSPSEITLHLFT